MTRVALRLQDRDFDLLRYLGHRGLADARSVKAAIFPGCGDRAFRRRTALLAEAGFVHRMSIGQYFADGGRQPYVYSLSEKGADILRSERGIENPRVLGEVSPGFVAHQLGVTDFLEGVERSAEAIGVEALRWMLEYDPTERFRTDPDPRTPYHERYVLHERFQSQNGRSKPFSYRPDASFLLTHGGRQLIGYVERDNSTEPLRVIASKMRAVKRLIEERRFTGHWPELTDDKPSIRVFLLAKSKRRIRFVLEHVAANGGADMLRCACDGELHRNVFTDAIWYSIKGGDQPGAIIHA